MDLQVHNINIYIYVCFEKYTNTKQMKRHKFTVEKNQDTNVTVP